MPEKLHELQRLWLIEAVKYNVLPIDDRGAERLNAELAGRPQLIRGTSQLLFPGMKRLSENSVINIKNKSFSVTVQLEVGDDPSRRRDDRPGWGIRRLGALRLRTAGPSSSTTCLGIQCFRHRGELSRYRPVHIRCGWSSPTTAVGWPRVGTSTLFYDGQSRRGRKSRSDATDDLLGGRDHGHRRRLRDARLSGLHPENSKFNGKIDLVQIDVGEDSHDHLVDPQELIRVAMSRQ